MPVKKAVQGSWRISGFMFQLLTAPRWLKVDQQEETKKAAEIALSITGLQHRRRLDR